MQKKRQKKYDAEDDDLYVLDTDIHHLQKI